MDESEMTDQEKAVKELWDQGHREKRKIADRLAMNVKRVRRILKRLGLSEEPPPAPSKIAPFHDRIRELKATGLTNTRIRSDIEKEGYTGSKTILDDFIRTLSTPVKSLRGRFRRFETEPGVEAQADWTTHRVPIAGTLRVVHFFAMVLAWSRFFFIGAYRNEKQATLLAAHVEAFDSFGGVTSRIVYDNMSTVVLGRRGRDVIWNPQLIAFARHWCFDPRACRPGDPNRKGKVESPLAYHGHSFVKGRAFDSWDHLETEQRAWLEVANARVHGTTRQVPAERLERERPLLTRPPDTPFPAYREEQRSVYRDCTISVGQVKYSVPAELAHRTVSIRIHLRHIEVLDGRGRVCARHAIHEPSAGLVIDPQHIETIRRGPAPTASALEARFLSRFPGADDFLAGLRRRMKSFAYRHIVQLERLAARFGTTATADAIDHAAKYRNFNAAAVARILADWYPLLAAMDSDALQSTASAAANHALVDETDTGSLADYDLDRITHTEEDGDGSACVSV